MFIAGNGRVDNNGVTNKSFLMTWDSNPGAKTATAFPLAELTKLVQESPAAGIYLTIDLTGDGMQPELEAMAKSPLVVLAAISSGSDLSLAAALARALSGNSRQSVATAGQLLELLKPAISNKQIYLEARQPNTVLFSEAPLVAVVKPPVESPKPAALKLEEKASEPQSATPAPPTAAPPAPNPAKEAQQTADQVKALLDTARTDRDRSLWDEVIVNCKAALRLRCQLEQGNDAIVVRLHRPSSRAHS